MFLGKVDLKSADISLNHAIPFSLPHKIYSYSPYPISTFLSKTNYHTLIKIASRAWAKILDKLFNIHIQPRHRCRINIPRI